MKLFLLIALCFIPSFCFAFQETSYNCGKGATAVVSHPNKLGDLIIVNGVEFNTNSVDFNESFHCYSTLKIGCADGDYAVSILPDGESSQELTYRQIASFFVGAFAAMAFVIASRSDV